MLASSCISLRCQRLRAACPLRCQRNCGPVLGGFTPTSHELQEDDLIGSAQIRSEPYMDIIDLENFHLLEMCFVVMCENTVNFKMSFSILPN